jgi:hypothetical protein
MTARRTVVVAEHAPEPRLSVVVEDDPLSRDHDPIVVYGDVAHVSELDRERLDGSVDEAAVPWARRCTLAAVDTLGEVFSAVPVWTEAVGLPSTRAPME